MNIPESIWAALAAADDDYLVGLSNKGTVNRAKKDLAGLTPTAEAAGEMVVVTMGEETVMLVSVIIKVVRARDGEFFKHFVGGIF